MNYRDCEIAPFKGEYKVYEDGGIWSYKRKVFLKQQVTGNGHNKYVKVRLTSGKVKQWMGVHLLVLHHWVSPRPSPAEGIRVYVGSWKDGNHMNNHWSNLMWNTHQRNLVKIRGERPWFTGNKKGHVVSAETRRAMSRAKWRKVLLVSEDEEIRCRNVEDAAYILDTYARKVHRYAKTGKEICGYLVKFI